MKFLIQNLEQEKATSENKIQNLNEKINELGFAKSDLESRLDDSKKLIDQVDELNKNIKTLESEKFVSYSYLFLKTELILFIEE